MLKYALLFHLAIGIYMYGSPLIFPESVSQLSDSVNSNLSSNGIGDYVIGSAEGQAIL